MVLAAAETFQEIHEIGEYNAILSTILVITFIVLVVVGIQKIKEVFGFKTKDELYKQEIDKRLKDIEDRLNRHSDKISHYEKKLHDIDKKMDDFTESFSNNQKKYHSQSIEIRGELKNNQVTLQDNQVALQDDVHKFIDLFQEYMDKDNKRTIVTLRASLWRLHGEFVKQGFVTPDSLKTFMEMGKFYEAAGGNDIFHEKLKPEVEALEIRYPDGSIYTKNII